MDLTGGPSTTPPSTPPFPPPQSAVEPRGGTLLGKRVAPEDDEGRCHSPSTGPHPLGIGVQVRAEIRGGLPTHSGPPPTECAPSSTQDKIRDAQYGPLFEQVTGRWGLD
jgi:hypothetical protein